MKAKSKAVKELIDLIYTNPEIFKAEDEDSLCSDNYRMTCMFGFFRDHKFSSSKGVLKNNKVWEIWLSRAVSRAC